MCTHHWTGQGSGPGRRLGGAALLVAALAITGCESSGGGDTLRAVNQRLAAELTEARADISRLQAERQALQSTVADQAAVIDILNTEKTSQVQASGRLRSQARSFVQAQLREFRDFLRQGDLLDYLGGELVARANLDGEDLTVVDTAAAVPRAGTLSGVAGYFAQAGEVQVKILRPVEDNWVVLWESRPLAVAGSGVQRLEFPVAVGVEPGDLLAYHFPGPVLVPWDRGTGQALLSNRDMRLGATLRPSDLSGRDQQRAYSVGVYGLLD